MIRILATKLAWLVAAAGIALGAAGLASGLDHPATAGGRDELTSLADASIAPGLDAATNDLRALSDEVSGLADLGRTALTALVARDVDGLRRAIDAGKTRIVTIQAAAAALKARLATLPGVGPGATGRLGTVPRARLAAIAAALPSVDGLDESWTRLAAASVDAVDLTGRLLAHDEIAGQAVRLGSAGTYGKALSTLAKAEAELIAAQKVRDRLAASVDVRTLDDWIGRNLAYDRAVRALWQAMVTSKGKVTKAVRDAAAKAEAARRALPPDARALVVILGDVARGGLNQAVIEVETARGGLLDGLANALDVAEESGAPAAGGSPTASP